MLKVLKKMFAKKAMRIRVEGPLDSKNEEQIMRQLDFACKRAQSILVIINSYGGSLSVAKNISCYLRALNDKQIPVYCFAEQYCLNTANIILTSGQLCFAHKMSVLGDIAFAYQRYALNNIVGLESISHPAKSCQILLGGYQLLREQDINKLIIESQKELKELITVNRETEVRKKDNDLGQFRKRILKGGSITPKQALDLGLIDGIKSHDRFMRQELKDWRVLQGKEEHKYRAINFLRSMLEVFRQQ